MRMFTNPTPPVPDVHLLSNGSYHVAISSAGGGYSRWRDLAVTRWREDATRDCWGTFVYLRDPATGRFLVHRLSTHLAGDQRAMKPSSRSHGPSSAIAMRNSTSTRKSASRRKTTWNCGASPSATAPRWRA